MLDYRTRRKKLIGFILLFLLFLVLEYFFFYLLSPHFADFQRETTAKFLCFLLTLLGIPASRSYDIVKLGSVSLRIVYECTGGFAFFIFSSATLAFPTSWAKRLTAQLIGLISIFLLNSIRLVLISWIAYRSPNVFDFIHKYLWQVTFPVVVVLLFILWARKCKVE